jgi:succinyl-diaminopimelate desuccinylase
VSEDLVFDVSAGVVELTRALCDVESVSGNEEHLANRVEATLRSAAHLDVIRDGNTVAARTSVGARTRVIVAGHLDTVPVDNNLPSRIEDDHVVGRGSVDMKGGVASQLILACELDHPAMDVTWIFYDQEEIEADKNGLGRFHRNHPEWLEGDFAVLGEPSLGGVEGGCNGTIRVELRATGLRAHSARPWMGDNAIHKLSDALERLSHFSPETRSVDGLDYRESLSAVGVRGGVAGNVIPDEAVLTVNFRFAPDRSVSDAVEYVADVFPGLELTVVDASEGARPGLDSQLALSLVAASAHEARPKYGWTDVSRFSELGIPAVNFGPGDGALAHAPNEKVPISQLESTHRTLRDWLSQG